MIDLKLLDINLMKFIYFIRSMSKVINKVFILLSWLWMLHIIIFNFLEKMSPRDYMKHLKNWNSINDENIENILFAISLK